MDCEGCICKDCPHNKEDSCGRCNGYGQGCYGSFWTDECIVIVRGRDLRYQ